MRFYVLMTILVSFCFPGGMALLPIIHPAAASGIAVIGLVAAYLLKQEASHGELLAKQQGKTEFFEKLAASYKETDRFFWIGLVGGLLLMSVRHELGAAILVSSFVIHAVFRFRLWGHLAWFRATTTKEAS